MTRKRFFRWTRGRVIAACLLAVLLWQGPGWVATFCKWQVRRALEKREPERAHWWLDHSHQFLADDPQAAFLRARAYRKQGDMAHVHTWLEEALRRGMPKKRIQREEWLAFAQSGQFRQAGPHLTELLLSPGDDAGDICEAFVTGYIRTSQFSKALVLIESWSADFPQDALPHYLKGRVLVLRKRYSQAEQAFSRAGELNPRYEDAILARADVLRTLKRPEEALKLYQRGASSAEGKRTAEIGQAVALKMLGRTEQARSILRRVLAEDPSAESAATELGQLELQDGHVDLAIHWLRIAFQQNPHSIETRYALAQALQRTGNETEASKQFRWVQTARKAMVRFTEIEDELAKRPDDVELLFELSRLKYDYMSREDAILGFMAVLDRAPNHPAAHGALAKYYREKAAKDPRYAKLADQHARMAASGTGTAD